MLISDILLLADINVPNNLQSGIKIIFLNEICKQLHREYPYTDEVYPFITIADQAFYEFPANCPENGINSIQIDEQTYTFRTREEMDVDYSWSIVADQLAINPVPKTPMLAYIYYRPQPTTFTEADLAQEPDFPDDFREALVYGISKRIAVTLPTPDLKLAAYYGNEMDKLVEFARKSLQIKPKKRVGIYRVWS